MSGYLRRPSSGGTVKVKSAVRSLPVTVAAAAAAMVCALSGCGPSAVSGNGSPSAGASGYDVPTAGVVQLAGSTFVVSELTVDRRKRKVLDPVTVMFDSASFSLSTPCNSMGGDVTYQESSLVVGPVAATLKGCLPQLVYQEQVLAKLFESDPQWRLDGTKLVLNGAGIKLTADLLAADSAG